MRENLPYESVYFKELHDEQDPNAIDWQYTEQGQV